MTRLFSAMIMIFFLTVSLKAQQEAVFTQYHLNPAWINPAYSGFNKDQNLFLNYRANWSDFEGAPRTYSANYHGAVADRVGLGVLVGAESIGQWDEFRAGVAFAYQFGSEDWDFSIGLSPEFQKGSLNGILNIEDPNDPVIMEAINGVSYFNLNTGIYGEYKGKLFGGLSLPQMIRARIDEVDFVPDDNSFFQYFTFLMGYRFDVSGYDIKLEPSVFMKRLDNIDFQVDMNLKASFLQDQLIGGISYSTGAGDRFGFLIGTQLKAFKLYYSYDVSFEPLQDYANGSHEVTLGFRWPKRMVSEDIEK